MMFLSFIKFTRKYLCRSLTLKEQVAADWLKRLRLRCLPIGFAKILRTPISKNDLLPMTACRFHVICVDQSNFNFCAM